MIQLTVEFLKFGALGIRSAPHGVFEIIQIGSGPTGQAVARVEVEKAGHPILRMSRLDPQERPLNRWAMATVDRAVLENWSDETPTDCKLTASGKDDGMEIVLSGHCGYRSFRWRAEVQLVNGEALIRGPSLTSDPDS